jgi:hypothetical protein
MNINTNDSSINQLTAQQQLTNADGHGMRDVLRQCGCPLNNKMINNEENRVADAHLHFQALYLKPESEINFHDRYLK